MAAYLFPPLRALLLLGGALLLATAWGCNSGQKPVYPVKGRLTWEDGSKVTQLSGGMVIFQCDTEEMSAKASIDEQGAFVLGTYKLDDGAVAGKHKVAIMQPADENAGDYRALQVVDRKYESMETTDLEATIEAKTNEIVLKVAPGSWMKRQKK
jgi:hypothetical protein